jgi:actin related protein 2/3 complex subunit 2
MILLENINTITHDLILAFLQNAENRIDTKCSDFDGCQLHIWTEDSGNVSVSLKSGAAQSLLSNGGKEVLSQVYGTNVANPEPGYDVQITANVAQLPPGEREGFATKFAQLKAHLYSAPVMVRIQSASSNSSMAGWADVPIRSVNERMWVKQDDMERMTVIFSVDFSDPDDAVFGRVFLNEIKKPVQGAPTVDYVLKNPPMELKGITSPPRGENVSYVTFVLFKRHWTPINKAQGCAFSMISFRNYLHYHIKCCKSYLHTRMRTQVENLLKVLNRAKQDTPKEKKTASGRTFVRK